MRIDQVQVFPISFGGYCNYVLVKIATDAGTVGWGDASLIGRETAVVSVLNDSFIPLLLGRDPLDSEDIWQTLYRGGYWRGGPILMSAIAGIDLALWDLKGKHAQMPVYQLLGGRCRDGVLAYSHASGATLEEITNSAKALMDQGFRVVRCQGSDYSWTPSPPSARSDSWPPIADGIAVETFDSSRYVRGVSMMFEHLRAQLGDDVELCHDAHQRLSPPEAARLAAILEPFRPFFLEDPLRPEDAHRLRDVRSASTTPIAMGELLHSLADCVSFLKEGFVDFIRCDLAHSGGVTEARRIAAVAGASGVKTAWHGPADISPIAQAASIHLDLSTPNFGVQEFTAYPDSVREVIESGVLFKDGFLYLSEDPGLGVSVNERELTNFPYRPKLLPMARRTDGSFQDW